MGKPFVVCEIATSLDGAISGPYYRDPRAKEPKAIFRAIAESYGYDIQIMGASTAAKLWTDGRIDVTMLPPATQAYAREDYIAPVKADSYYAIVNGSGNLAYKENLIAKDEVFVDASKRTWYHPIEVMLENVSDAYIQYLREKQISYIFAGKNEFDAELCIEKLGRLFGAKRIIIKGGGLVNYSFLKAGAIDEYAQLIFPYTDGARGIAKAFDRAEHDTNELMIYDFELIEAKAMGADCVLLRYRPRNAKS